MIEADRTLFSVGQRDGDPFVSMYQNFPDVPLATIRERLDGYLTTCPQGRNNFEGVRTQRVYSLVALDEIFAHTAEHRAVLDLVDRLLAPKYLLTASQAICTSFGETPQPLHFDDAFYTMPRPRRPVSVSTIWAVDPFSEQNGATEVIPGSHLWGDDRASGIYRGSDDVPLREDLEAFLVPVSMPAGSCVVFAGTLIHRGGAHPSHAPRRAFSHQYCEPWARQQENFLLSVPRDRAARLSPRIQQLLGYSIHGPFMGHVAGHYPIKCLGHDVRTRKSARRIERVPGLRGDTVFAEGLRVSPPKSSAEE